MEHYGEDIDLVVFISDGQESYYSKVMPLYFPRSAEEEAYAAKALPAALGNEYGEPVIAERTIRITSNPVASGGWGLYTLLHCHRCTPSVLTMYMYVKVLVTLNHQAAVMWEYFEGEKQVGRK